MKFLTSNRNLQGWFSILVLTFISLVLQEHLAWMSQYPSDPVSYTQLRAHET